MSSRAGENLAASPELGHQVSPHWCPAFCPVLGTSAGEVVISSMDKVSGRRRASS